jgi:hypothetical protein
MLFKQSGNLVFTPTPLTFHCYKIIKMLYTSGWWLEKKVRDPRNVLSFKCHAAWHGNRI